MKTSAWTTYISPLLLLSKAWGKHTQICHCWRNTILTIPSNRIPWKLLVHFHTSYSHSKTRILRRMLRSIWSRGCIPVVLRFFRRIHQDNRLLSCQRKQLDCRFTHATSEHCRQLVHIVRSRCYCIRLLYERGRHLSGYDDIYCRSGRYVCGSTSFFSFI